MATEKDAGWAWVCVLGSFYAHVVVIGFIQSFGVLYVELIDYFETSRGETAWVGSIASGFMFLLGPLDGLIVSAVGVRQTAVLGSIVACVGCMVTWYARLPLAYLYLSYGVMVGTGFSMQIFTSLLTVNQYFDKRRGLANSLASLGGGFGSLALPPLMSTLISEYSWSGAVLIAGGITLNFAVFGALYRPFQRESNSVLEDRSIRKATFLSRILRVSKIVTDPAYCITVVAVLLGDFVVFVPTSHLPDLAGNRGIPLSHAVYLVSGIGGGSIVGCVFFGWLADLDFVNRRVLFGMSCIVCGVSTLFTPLLSSFAWLMGYAVVFGIFIGVFRSLQEVVVVDILQPEHFTSGIAIFMGLRGVVVLGGSPMAGWLFDITGNYNITFIVTGCFFAAAGAVILVFHVITNNSKISCIQKKKQTFELDSYLPSI